MPTRDIGGLAMMFSKGEARGGFIQGGGVSEKSDSVGGFEQPPSFLKMVRGGV